MNKSNLSFNEAEKMKEFMLFQAGDMQLGLELSFVKNVYRNSDLSEIIVPEDHTSIFILDEQEIPLYDFPMIFGFKRSDYEAAFQKVMRLEVHGKFIAIRVDHIDRVVEVQEEQIEPVPPVINGKSLKWFPWVLKHEGYLIPALSPEGMAGIEPESIHPGAVSDNGESDADKAVLDLFFSKIMRQEAVAHMPINTLCF